MQLFSAITLLVLVATPLATAQRNLYLHDDLYARDEFYARNAPLHAREAGEDAVYAQKFRRTPKRRPASSKAGDSQPVR
ncbi:hypothetical protein MMC34_007998 [Xylographa carneopallida]|nr:hypothetical protein [Xylographa carneopallida]